MTNSKTATQKPEKPYAGFPLFPHANGQWAKKILGKLRYFGRIGDGWELALDLYNDQKEDLHAGREPAMSADGLTIEDLWETFLDDFLMQVERGRKGRGSYSDHVHTGKFVVGYLGRNTPVATLRGGDWKRLRDHWEAKGYAPSTMAGHIARTRAVANWAFHDEELLETPIRFGRNFCRPAKVEFRKHRDSKCAKIFTREEIHAMLNHARPIMRAMIMLGINVGCGNKDLGFLEFRHLELDAGWLQSRRTKTWVARRAWLWPETIDAVRTYLEHRPAPSVERLAERIFLTKYGGPWAFQDKRDSPIASEFAKLRRTCDLANSNGFYALRHTFRTEANEQVPSDLEAINLTMGHANNKIDDEYIERFPDVRLERVSGFVRDWFYGAKATGSGNNPKVIGQDA